VKIDKRNFATLNTPGTFTAQIANLVNSDKTCGGLVG